MNIELLLVHPEVIMYVDILRFCTALGSLHINIGTKYGAVSPPQKKCSLNRPVKCPVKALQQKQCHRDWQVTLTQLHLPFQSIDQ